MSVLFITIEGIDGSGKSTQSERLSKWLEERTGRRTLRTYEPGGWPGGKTFRELILNSEGYSSMTELLMFLADRAEHVKRVILPALRQNQNVICERYNESTLAYQAGGHELNPTQVKRIIRACNFPEPDIKILLDISPELAIERIKQRNGKSDKFEAEGLSLMKAVSTFYRLMAQDDPKKFLRILCDGLSEEEVFAAMKTRLEAMM